MAGVSIGSVGWRSSIGSWRRELDARWRDLDPTTRTRVQLAVFIVSVLLAYHYSLRTLVANLNVDTPLAYIGLVPAIALALAAMRQRPTRGEPSIHDRQLDLIIGVPLIASAVAINVILPNRLSTMFWVWRIDLLSLPLFVAGAVSVIFGTRVLWRQKLAIAYLFLAWPLPYTVVLLKVLTGFTNLTLSALRELIKVIPVAHTIGGADGSLFQVSHNGRAFPVSVVSACSGVDGIVGFILVGSAFAALVTGPRVRKALWLVGGMLLLWVINLARIMFIFWAGRTWGEHVAINILHPFVGLVTFSFGVILMMVVLRPFGLRIGFDPPPPVDPSARRVVAVPSILPAVAIVGVAAVMLGVINTNLKVYDLVADSAGEPKLASYLANPAAPTGWKPVYNTTYTWATPYFGENSTWVRYLYSEMPGGTGDLHSIFPVTADVIDTTNLSSFSAYGVEACYKFHGYNLKDVAQVSLGGGIRGEALSYTTSNHGDWSIVYWIWPVKSSGATHFQRVILYIQDSPGTVVQYPGKVTGISSLHGALSTTDRNDVRLINERAFLVRFAQEVIQKQTKIVPGTQLTGLQSDIAATKAAQAGVAPGASPTSVAHVQKKPVSAYPKAFQQWVAKKQQSMQQQSSKVAAP
jgi:exosortase/archaeosortase family protein